MKYQAVLIPHSSRILPASTFPANLVEKAHFAIVIDEDLLCSGCTIDYDIENSHISINNYSEHPVLLQKEQEFAHILSVEV